MPSVIMPSVIILSVVMPSVIMPNVMAPQMKLSNKEKPSKVRIICLKKFCFFSLTSDVELHASFTLVFLQRKLEHPSNRRH
jgi:hypothetical protein